MASYAEAKFCCGKEMTRLVSAPQYVCMCCGKKAAAYNARSSTYDRPDGGPRAESQQEYFGLDKGKK